MVTINRLEKYSDEDLFAIFDADIEKEIKARGYTYGWYKETVYAGDIYILVNPAFPNLIKIGYADDVVKRVKSFNRNSGLPDPYHVYATYKVKKRLEDLKLHDLIDSLDSTLRHSKNREFYEMTPEQAYGILSVIAQINGSEDLLKLNPLNDDFFTEQEPKQESASIPVKQSKRDFSVIPNGIYYLDRVIKRWDKRHVTGQLKVEDGRFIVLKGSICCPVKGYGFSLRTIEKNRSAAKIADNILVDDFEVSSPSAASDFLIYSNSNGWGNWKTADGKPLDVFRK